MSSACESNWSRNVVQVMLLSHTVLVPLWLPLLLLLKNKVCPENVESNPNPAHDIIQGWHIIIHNAGMCLLSRQLAQGCHTWFNTQTSGITFSISLCYILKPWLGWTHLIKHARLSVCLTRNYSFVLNRWPPYEVGIRGSCGNRSWGGLSWPVSHSMHGTTKSLPAVCHI